LGSLTAANWVSFDFNVSYSSRWGYSLIKKKRLQEYRSIRARNLTVTTKLREGQRCGGFTNTQTNSASRKPQRLIKQSNAHSAHIYTQVHIYKYTHIYIYIYIYPPNNREIALWTTWTLTLTKEHYIIFTSIDWLVPDNHILQHIYDRMSPSSDL